MCKKRKNFFVKFIELIIRKVYCEFLVFGLIKTVVLGGGIRTLVVAWVSIGFKGDECARTGVRLKGDSLKFVFSNFCRELRASLNFSVLNSSF